MEKDPEEQSNLAANPEYADVLARMKTMMSDEMQDLPRPFGEFKKGKE